MAEGFEVVKTPDGRVFVILHPLCKASREDILGLLEQAGVDRLNVTFVSPEDACDLPSIEKAMIVIPLNADICEAPELEDAGRHCGQAGGNVVVIIERGFGYPDLHPIAEKYGTQCSWSAEDLERCISSEGLAEPSDSQGQPVSRPGGKQVNC